jgi:hypothetical protein
MDLLEETALHDHLTILQAPSSPPSALDRSQLQECSTSKLY